MYRLALRASEWSPPPEAEPSDIQADYNDNVVTDGDTTVPVLHSALQYVTADDEEVTNSDDVRL